MLRTCTALCALGLWLAAASALGRPAATYDKPEGAWKEAADANGVVFTLQGKKARATITLHLPDPAPEGAAEFARQLSANPGPDLVDRSEVQTFKSSTDDREVVAVDGKLNPSRAPARHCWVFDRGQRVFAEYVAGDLAEFKRHEAAFMAFVSQVKVPPEAPPATANPPVAVNPPAAAPSPVDATLRFTLPSGWTRTDSGGVTWLRAPSNGATSTFILVTPAEKLSGDFGTWVERKLSPGPGVKIISHGPADRRQASATHEDLNEHLVLEVRAGERHEQQVAALRRGQAVVLVALDSTSPSALAAQDATFRTFLAGLQIRSELSGEAAPVVSAPQGFPTLVLPAGWALASDDHNWRTYRTAAATATSTNVMLVSQVVGLADPARAINDARRSLGYGTARTPEVLPVTSGAQLFRVVDPSGPLATETVVLAGSGKQLLLIMRAQTPALLESQRAAFEQVVAGVKL